MAYEMWTSFYHQFWSDSFWLPEGVGWEDMKPTSELNLPDSDDLWTYPLIIGVAILLFRIFIFIRVFTYIGKRLGLSDIPISEEEKVPSYNRDRSNKESKRLLKEEKKVTQLSAPSQCDKFCRASFSLCFRLSYSIFGFFVLYNEPWVGDIRNCWRSYPFHSLSTGLWWFYIIGLSFYWSLLIWDFADPPSKGKIAFYLHHGFTTSIIIFSWLVNLVRPGALIFFLHDSCDVFLEMAKISIYLKQELFVDIFFTISIITWVYFRVVLFGGIIIRSAIFEAHEYNFMPAAYLFFALLLALFVLNVIWISMFFIAGYRRITTGKYGANKEEKIEEGKGKQKKLKENKDRSPSHRQTNGYLSHNGSSGDLYLTKRKKTRDNSKSPSKSPVKSSSTSSSKKHSNISHNSPSKNNSRK